MLPGMLVIMQMFLFVLISQIVNFYFGVGQITSQILSPKNEFGSTMLLTKVGMKMVVVSQCLTKEILIQTLKLLRIMMQG